MKAVQIDRMKTNDTSDAFCAVGYRKFVLKMFELSLYDMLGKDEVMSKTARNWFDPVMGRDAPITFEDCVYALGMASHLESIRSKALNTPKQMLDEIEKALQSLSREGVKWSVHRHGQSEMAAPVGLEVDSSAASQIQRAMFSHG